MRRSMGLLVLCLILVFVTACGKGNSESGDSAKGDSDEGFPNKPIKIIVSFEAGGTSDAGARMLAPFLEEELGVPVSIVNKPGGGGWIGWAELANSKPDGYTLGYFGTPNFITGYLNPELKREMDQSDFSYIAKHVTDPGVIAIQNNEKRFGDLNELFDYAKKNELTGTTTGVGSNDHISILNVNNKFNTDFTAVHTEGSSEQVAAVLGNNVDVLFATVGDVVNLEKNDEIETLAIMSDERSSLMPDVPTLEESGYENIITGGNRGFGGPKGIDPEKLEILQNAFEKAINNPEHIEQMEKNGLEIQ